MVIQFRTKVRGAGVVHVPEIKRHHCDMHAFRTSRAFGPYANSDLFPAILKRALRAMGIGERIDIAAPPAGVTVDTSSFLACVTIDVPDVRPW